MLPKIRYFPTVTGIISLLLLLPGSFEPILAESFSHQPSTLPKDSLPTIAPDPTKVTNLTSLPTAAQLSPEPIYADPAHRVADLCEIADWFAQHNHTTNDPEDWPEPIHDGQLYWSVLVDQLEYRINDSKDLLYWDLHGWIGGDYQRFWVKSEGDVDINSGNGEAEVQALYSRLFAPYWEWQAGLRYDQLYGDTDRGRAFAVLGVEGLAPYFFEVDAALFVSQDGDVSARVKAEYELLLSQKWVLQPKVEVNAAIQRVDEFGVGSGINDLDLGLRLRYEVNRQFAPYVGVNWTKKFGETADFAVEEGEATDQVSAVVGLRLLF